MKVNVLYPQPQTFHEPKTCPIQQAGHKPVDTVERMEQHFDFWLRQDDRKMLRAFGMLDIVNPADVYVEHLPI